jgi:hypothetical protein
MGYATSLLSGGGSRVGTIQYKPTSAINEIKEMKLVNKASKTHRKKKKRQKKKSGERDICHVIYTREKHVRYT